MKDSKLNYLIGNGQACVMFLDELARCKADGIERNAILNHGLAVHSLISELRVVENENRSLRDRLHGCVEDLRKIHSGNIDEIVSRKFDNLKGQLLEAVCDLIENY